MALQKVFTPSYTQFLKNNIQVENYQKESFSYDASQTRFLSGVMHQDDLLQRLDSSPSGDYTTAIAIYEAFEKISPVFAQQDDLWTYLAHVDLFEYVKERWEIPSDVTDEEKINHIEHHWFRDKFTEAWTNVKNVFSVGGRIFEGIKDAISGVFKNVLNNIINGLNSVIASPFNTINGILDRIQNISIAGAQPFAGLTTRLPVPQIPNVYASGGFPDTGEFFMARENGIPEMVGKIGNRTAVANNTQIVEAIEQGVYRATTSANSDSSSTNYFNVNIGNRKVYSGVAQNVRTENNRYGVAVLEV